MSHFATVSNSPVALGVVFALLALVGISYVVGYFLQKKRTQAFEDYADQLASGAKPNIRTAKFGRKVPPALPTSPKWSAGTAPSDKAK